MFAIASNSQQLTGQSIGLRQWIDKYIGTFNEGCFVIKGINRHPIFGNHLKKMEISEIDRIAHPIAYYDGYVNGTLKIKDALILPFGVPTDDDQCHFYKSLICYCYTEDFDGKLPNDEIVATMMFAMIQHAIFRLARLDIQMSIEEQTHYMRVIVSILHTMRRFMMNSTIFLNLVHSLAQCADAKDVLQREIAAIIDNQPLTETFFEQILKWSIARKLNRAQRENEDVSLAKLENFSGMNALLIVAPLLSRSTSYDINKINILVQKMNECYASFMNGRTKESFERDDSHFDVSGEICHSLVAIMVNIIGIQIKVPQQAWFTSLFNDIKQKSFQFNKPNDRCPYNYTQFRMPIDRNGHVTVNVHYANNTFTPSSIVKWSAFVLNMNEGDSMLLFTETLGASTQNHGDTRMIQNNVANLVFVSKNDHTQLNYNYTGSYSPFTNQMYDPKIRAYVTAKPIQFPIKLICKNNTISVSSTDESYVPFQVIGKQIVIAIKNVGLKFDNSARGEVVKLFK